MTKDEIIAMAKEVGIHIDRLPDDYCKDVGLPIGSVSRWDGVGIDELQAFAALVAAAEREACAKVCDELAKMAATPESAACWMRLDCATAIRKRGAA